MKEHKTAALVVAASAAVVAGLAQIADLYKAPTWMSAVLVSVGALVALVTLFLSRSSEKRTEIARVLAEKDQWRRRIKQLLVTTADEENLLPIVRVADPYSAGVSKSIFYEAESGTPYVHRDIDDDLDEALRNTEFVLLSGDSKAGKSRTLYEAVLRNLPEATMLIPRGEPGALAELLEMNPCVYNWRDGDVVLWLDDIDRFLGGSNGLDDVMLQRFAKMPNRIVTVGTITSQRRDALFSAPGEIGRVSRITLARAADIRLESQLSDAEFRTATALYTGSPLRRELGEYLVAAPVLERKYDDGRQSAPEGWAVVQAAVDWRRAGLTRPIPHTVLFQLFALYLTAARVDRDPDDASFKTGLAWARAPVAAQIALLHRVERDNASAYTVFDYVVALADGQSGRQPVPVPEPTWRALIEQVEPLELIDLGVTSLARGMSEVAHRAFERATGSADSNAIALASNELGLLVADEGDPEAAERLYRKAVAAPEETEGRAWAANNLANLLADRGDLAEAMTWWRFAIIPINTQHSIPAYSLGVALEQLGRRDEAKESFRAAIRSGQTLRAATDAANHLGLMLAGEGDSAGAEAVFRAALGEHEIVTEQHAWVANNLANLLAVQGREDEAAEFHRRAVIDANSQYAIPAFSLAVHRERRGDLDGAIEMYVTAAESGQQVPQVHEAALRLGEIFARHSDPQNARIAYELAAESDDPDMAALAAERLREMQAGTAVPLQREPSAREREAGVPEPS